MFILVLFLCSLKFGENAENVTIEIVHKPAKCENFTKVGDKVKV
jgi:hypothetical protein